MASIEKRARNGQLRCYARFRDPSGAQLVEHWAGYAHNLAADTTRVVRRSRLDRHILPALGNHPVGAIRPSTVAAAVATWSTALAPGTVGHVLRQVRQILDAAMADGLVASNAAKAVKSPTAPRRRDVHLTDEDVTAVLGAARTTTARSSSPSSGSACESAKRAASAWKTSTSSTAPSASASNAALAVTWDD